MHKKYIQKTENTQPCSWPQALHKLPSLHSQSSSLGPTCLCINVKTSQCSINHQPETGPHLTVIADMVITHADSPFHSHSSKYHAVAVPEEHNLWWHFDTKDRGGLSMITLANSKSSEKSKNYNAAAGSILKCYSMMMMQRVKPSWVKLKKMIWSSKCFSEGAYVKQYTLVYKVMWTNVPRPKITHMDKTAATKIWNRTSCVPFLVV